jgi:lipopolysaccharide transport system permease protein
MTSLDKAARVQSPIGAIWSARWLLMQWIRRDFIAQYRQSILGTSWAIAQPVLLFVVYGVVFTQVLHVKATQGSYFVFAMSGLAPWLFISNVLTRASLSLVGSAGVLKQVYFSRAVLPLAATGLSIIDFVIATALLLASEGLTTGSIPITATALVPIDLGLVLVMAGVAIFIALFGALVRDVRFVIPTVLQLGIMLTPIMYPPSLIPKHLSWAETLNPVAQFVAATRSAVIYGVWPTALELIVPLVAGAGLLVGALWYSAAVEHRIVDVA